MRRRLSLGVSTHQCRCHRLDDASCTAGDDGGVPGAAGKDDGASPTRRFFFFFSASDRDASCAPVAVTRHTRRYPSNAKSTGFSWSKNSRTTDTLSREPRRIASATSCSPKKARAKVDSCRRSDTQVTASSDEKTSHNPSHAIMRNSSPLRSVVSVTSGSAMTTSPVKVASEKCVSFMSLMRMSPSDRVTPSAPFTRCTVTQPTNSSMSSSISQSSNPIAYNRGTFNTCDDATQPPCASMRARSSGRSGLWSVDRSSASPPRHSTARQSPELPTNSVLPRMSATSAVVPLRSAFGIAFARKAESTSTKAARSAAAGSWRKAGSRASRGCSCSATNSTAPRPA
mmetsp:Transcript_5744/g.18691  ORF Transcript_5744/g.18691 Transcript_5744/m.18691 type:complete len:342 (-) Transcript_5744:1380-2405(-)